MSTQVSKFPPFTLRTTDCVQFLKVRKANKKLQPIRLVCADPPYGFGQDYADYDDRTRGMEYLLWSYAWITEVVENLAPDGSMWLFVPDEWVAELDVHCRVYRGLKRINWVVWHFTFGQSARGRFTRSKLHLLYYCKDEKKRVFNANAVRVPSDRQLVYDDKRANGAGKLPNDTWVLTGEAMKEAVLPGSDVWLESRVCGTFKEREPHSPNQLPVPLLERIVLACSNPGDLVLAPFCGAGSEGVAAVRHGRRFLGLDVSESCITKSRERLERELDNR